MVSSFAARSLVATVLIAATASVGHAGPMKLDTRVVPSSGIVPADLTGAIIYLNPCDNEPTAGVCAIHAGQDDSSTNTSQIAAGESQFPAYADFLPGEWAAVVQCVKEVYSPYGVNIVDQRPAPGSIYSMIFVGGSGQAIGFTEPGVGGVAPVTQDCSVSSMSGVAYAFTDQITVFAGEDGGSRINGLCWIIAQETAHIYGLDHEFSFLDDGSSACNDPMTYRADCGGQKFFRNRDARCGEFDQPRPGCGITNACGFSQNSHQKMLNLFGPATPISAGPTITLLQPQPNAMVMGNTMVIAKAKAQRGISRLELWVNGFKWGAPVKGVPFGASGQPESGYTLLLPAAVPNSILDIVVKAFDDIGIEGDSTKLTVTKGAACTSADSCANGQKCEMGRCFWDPPAGNFGDACTFNEACLSGTCSPTASDQVCTHSCTLGVTGACEMGYECLGTSGAAGFCYPIQPAAGCCSVGHDSVESTVAKFGLAFGALGLVLRRRKRTQAR